MKKTKSVVYDDGCRMGRFADNRVAKKDCPGSGVWKMVILILNHSKTKNIRSFSIFGYVFGR